MEQKIAEVVSKYFMQSQIESIKLFGKRAIITITADKDQPEKQQLLKQELEKMDENLKKLTLLSKAKDKLRFSLRKDLTIKDNMGIAKKNYVIFTNFFFFVHFVRNG